MTSRRAFLALPVVLPALVKTKALPNQTFTGPAPVIRDLTDGVTYLYDGSRWLPIEGVPGPRRLFTHQLNPKDNGIWVARNGSWERPKDFG